MIVVDTVAALREAVSGFRRGGARVAFVPTMGNLHAGHVALVNEAKKRADAVVVSIFVNPLQFGPKEDFANYPRTPVQDRDALTQAGADMLFTPSDAEVYPRGSEHMTKVEVPRLGKILCGVSRPTHFAGVTTVVNRLFNLVAPDVALFGKKDYQQLRIIQFMVSDLGMPIEIVGIDTVREADGLAMSSRNSYLAADQRRIAPALYRALSTCAEIIHTGGSTAEEALAEARQALTTAGFRVDYVELRQAHDLGEPTADDRDLVVLAAAWLGTTRLIDNVELRR